MWCSVDPGSCGAIVVWDGENPVALHRLEDLLGKKDCLKYLDLDLSRCKRAYVEKVRGMFWDSSASAFNFGWNCGIIHQFFKGNIEYITPQKWMNAMHAGLPKALKTKERSGIVAKKLYADFIKTHNALRAKDDGVWDALLLGHYVLWAKKLDDALMGKDEEEDDENGKFDVAI